jgi:uncharacterized membrane protein YhaH (DUF805 family)
MRGIRQYLTKGQWFVLFNCGVIAAMYLSGNLHFAAVSLVPVLIALAVVNAMSAIAARRYTDWKK